MINELKKRLKDFVKSNKRISIIILACVVGIILVLSSNVFAEKKNENTKTSSGINNEKYETSLETRIKDIVSKIDGVGDVEVMVKTQGEGEKKFAKNTDRSISAGGDEKSKNEYVIVNSGSNDEGVLVNQEYPKIEGVIVVCSGGDNIKVKNDVTEAVSALLSVSKNNVSVLKMKNSED